MKDLIAQLANVRRESDERQAIAEVAEIVEGHLPRAWQAVRTAIYQGRHDDAERAFQLLAGLLADRGMMEWLPNMLAEAERLRRPGWQEALICGRLLLIANDAAEPMGSIAATLAEAAAVGVRPNPDELQSWFADCAENQGIPWPAQPRRPEPEPAKLVLVEESPATVAQPAAPCVWKPIGKMQVTFGFRSYNGFRTWLDSHKVPHRPLIGKNGQPNNRRREVDALALLAAFEADVTIVNDPVRVRRIEKFRDKLQVTKDLEREAMKMFGGK